MASPIYLVTSNDSTEFTQLEHALTHSYLIGLDAEWKPNREASTFPTVSLLQIACRLTDSDELPVFLLDLQAIPLSSVYELLSEVFVSPDVIKLGFRFKQDLMYLSSTFREQGLEPGFETVEPYIDINAIYSYLQPKQSARRASKQTKSLATICNEVLGITLSKEYQCSDWSQRPLTEEQKQYAASDASCLVEIFKVFWQRMAQEGYSSRNRNNQWASVVDLGLKQLFDNSNTCNLVTRTKFCEAAKMMSIAVRELHISIEATEEVESMCPQKTTKQLDDTLLWIIRKHGDKILLKDSDRTPKASRKKSRKSTSGLHSKPLPPGIIEDWDGTPPWDPSVGGDGCARFLCDVMVEGLAKHLRCVGIDAAIPNSKKPGSRELIDQAQKEKRVLLTRDAKLLRHEYLIKNQIYRIKSLLKNEQLVEVIETFQLKISEGQLMSRCTKCNGRFIQKPLTTEEAVEAAKGFQVIPNCLFNKNIEFWQCMDCNQLYWEGTQYHNAVQKFIDVCKLNE